MGGACCGTGEQHASSLISPLPPTAKVGNAEDLRLRILVVKAVGVPSQSRFNKGGSVYVKAMLVGQEEADFKACRTTSNPGPAPVWREEIELPGDPHAWDPNKQEITLSLYGSYDLIGSATMSLTDLFKRPTRTLLICDPADGNAVDSSDPRRKPCELTVSIMPETAPEAWGDQYPSNFCGKNRGANLREIYPKHIFMMSRGTRGDVQPFVALARGMAEQQGWMVTICTELRWKSFIVDKCSNLKRGCVRFRPSGGDTERRIDRWEAKKAMASKTEFIQSVMLAYSEAEFFNSAPVFIHYVEAMMASPTPIDLLVPGFTLTGLGMLVSECCGIPMAGFILQPSCIPSADPTWECVPAIESHSLGFIDDWEKNIFTSHSTLATMKWFAEHNPFNSYNLPRLRKEFGLQVAETWPTIQRLNIPMVIPMREGTFDRPSDWPSKHILTDFIFLRSSAPGGGELAPEVADFIAKARTDNRKLATMTFSSMPVSRKKMLQSAVLMLTEGKNPVNLIYAGKKQSDAVPANLEAQVNELKEKGLFLEVERADFALLFREMDCFIVHGGLGTTVEAFRMHKPVQVTGLLLMDQRFWGRVCELKGIGPAPVHIDNFHKSCVEFMDRALEPDSEWLKNAETMSWGVEADDGVESNVNTFVDLLVSELLPVQATQTLQERDLRRKSLKTKKSRKRRSSMNSQMSASTQMSEVTGPETGRSEFTGQETGRSSSSGSRIAPEPDPIMLYPEFERSARLDSQQIVRHPDSIIPSSGIPGHAQNQSLLRNQKRLPPLINVGPDLQDGHPVRPKLESSPTQCAAADAEQARLLNKLNFQSSYMDQVLQGHSDGEAVFRAFDSEGTGELDETSLMRGLADFGLQDDDIEGLMLELRPTIDGHVLLREFCRGWDKIKGIPSSGSRYSTPARSRPVLPDSVAECWSPSGQESKELAKQLEDICHTDRSESTDAGSMINSQQATMGTQPQILIENRLHYSGLESPEVVLEERDVNKSMKLQEIEVTLKNRERQLEQRLAEVLEREQQLAEIERQAQERDKTKHRSHLIMDDFNEEAQQQLIANLAGEMGVAQDRLRIVGIEAGSPSTGREHRKASTNRGKNDS